MSREIKFRGRDYKGNWRYGTYFFGVQYPESFEGHYVCGWQVDPETIGQYVGLKDKNGKEFYDGDIYKSWYSRDTSGTDIIEFVELVQFDINEGKGYSGWEIVFLQNSEIIGNIYENPELLTNR